jgi:phosphoglycolate phosphatase
VLHSYIPVIAGTGWIGIRMAISHIAFDMDGVLFSSEGFIGNAYEDAIIRANLNLSLPSSETIIQQVGKPITEIFRNVFPGITAEEITILHKETLISVVNMINEGRGHMYEGIPEAVSNLSKSYKLFIVSNGRRKYIEAVLHYYKLSQFFQTVLTLEDLLLNNKGELLQAYIKDESNTAENWVMIGDRRADINAARYAGCKFIGCLWGHGNMIEIGEADVLLKKPEELVQLRMSI